MLIHQIQLPENLTSSLPVSTPTAPTAAVPVNTNTSYPPTPAPTSTNQTPAPPQPTTTNAQAPVPVGPPSFFSFFIQHVRTDPQARLCKAVFLSSLSLCFRLTWFNLPGVTLFIFLTFIVRVILSPTLSMIFVAVAYSLIWLPQIVRSARRGRTSGLSKEYVIGTTVCRLYLALCESLFDMRGTAEC